MSTTEPAPGPARWYSTQRLEDPTPRLNRANPSDPFVVVDFPTGSYISFDDPATGDQLAAAFTEAARLLREAIAAARDDEALS